MYRASFIAHNVEIINTYAMTSGAEMAKYEGGGLLVLFEPLTSYPVLWSSGLLLVATLGWWSLWFLALW